MFESFDAIRREDQVQIEGAVSELNEILALPNLLLFLLGQPETQFQKGANQFAAVRGLLLHIKTDILGGVRISQQDCPGSSEEQVLYAAILEDTAKLLSVLEFKDCHVRAYSRL